MRKLNSSNRKRIAVRANQPVVELVEDAQTLANRCRFVLDEEQWQAFQEAMDRHVQSKPRLQKLLQTSVIGQL